MKKNHRGRRVSESSASESTEENLRQTLQSIVDPTTSSNTARLRQSKLSSSQQGTSYYYTKTPSRCPTPNPYRNVLTGLAGETVRDTDEDFPGNDGMVEIRRPVYSQQLFGKTYHEDEDEDNFIRNHFLDTVFLPIKAKRTCFDYLILYFPFIKMLREYSFKEFFLIDFVSGITTGVMRIPQSMAYALLAYLSPVYGLYTAFIAGMVYFFLGTSPHLCMTSQGVVSLMVGTIGKKILSRRFPGMLANMTQAENNTVILTTQSTENITVSIDFLEIVLVITMVVGICQVIFSILHLGMLTNYLSAPLIGGFTTGAAIEVIVSQLSAMLGMEIEVPPGTPPEGVLDNFKIVYFALAGLGHSNWLTILISAISIILLILLKVGNNKLGKFCKIPIPGELLVIILVTVISSVANFDRFNVEQVGEIPQGFASLKIPRMEIVDFQMIQECLILGIVSFAISLSVAKKFALLHDTEIDANQEFLAYGAGNILGSFSNCFVASSSMSCSSLHESLGGKSQIANLVASALVLATLLFAGSLFAYTPTCILSGIIIVNLKSMLWQFADVPRLWRVSKIDCSLWIVTFLAVICINVDTGLLIGIVFSLLTIVFRSQWPYSCILGRIQRTDIYKNILITKEAEEIDGIKIFRFEGSLYFASADHFRHSLYLMTGCNPRKLVIQRQMYDDKIRTIRQTMKEALPFFQSSRYYNRLSETELGNQSDTHVTSKTGRLCSRSSTITDYGALPKNMTVSDLRPSTTLHHVIIDLSSCSFIDSVGLCMLNQVLDDYEEAGVVVYFSNCRAAVRSMLNNSDVSKVDMKRLFLSNHDAVSAALAEAHKIEECNWLLFDSMANRRIDHVKQHNVSCRQSEFGDQAVDDLDFQSLPESIRDEYAVSESDLQRPNSCVADVPLINLQDDDRFSTKSVQGSILSRVSDESENDGQSDDENKRNNESKH